MTTCIIEYVPPSTPRFTVRNAVYTFVRHVLNTTIYSHNRFLISSFKATISRRCIQRCMWKIISNVQTTLMRILSCTVKIMKLFVAVRAVQKITMSVNRSTSLTSVKILKQVKIIHILKQILNHLRLRRSNISRA